MFNYFYAEGKAKLLEDQLDLKVVELRDSIELDLVELRDSREELELICLIISMQRIRRSCWKTSWS